MIPRERKIKLQIRGRKKAMDRMCLAGAWGRGKGIPATV